MSAEEIVTGAIAAAIVVVSGALYALLFALGRLYDSAVLSRLGWLAYAALAIAAFVLAGALGLRSGWLWVVAVMLVGYLLAPSAIWHLSVATHMDADETDAIRPLRES